MGNILGGILGGGLLMGGVKEFNDISKSLRQVSMLSDDINLKKLKEQAELLEKTYGIKQVDSINAFYQAISAGNNQMHSEEILDVAAALASVGAAAGDTTDVSGALDGLTSVLNAFGIGADKARESADMMMQSIVGGKTSINEMAGSLGSVAPIANTLGLHLIDILAPLDALTAQGMSTDEAMTAIKQIMMSMLKPSEDLEKQITALGYATGAQMLQNLGLAETLNVLSKSVDGTKVQ